MIDNGGNPFENNLHWGRRVGRKRAFPACRVSWGKDRRMMSAGHFSHSEDSMPLPSVIALMVPSGHLV